MKIKANDMKSCLNCQYADAFIVPDACSFDLVDLQVECVKDTTMDVKLMIGDDCPSWEKKG